MGLTGEQIIEINDAYSDVLRELKRLILKALPFGRSLENENAHAFEYFTYGLLRRTYLIIRCIENFVEISPPANPAYLQDERRKDLELFLQSFLLNIEGGLDNLALVWFFKRNIDKIENISEFRKHVGLFAPRFQKYLDESVKVKCIEFKQWHRHLKDMRDPVAHRVPIYIPPYTVVSKDFEQHNSLEQQLISEPWKEKQLTIQEELDKLSDYEPVYMHSFIEQSPLVRFHPQNVADTRAFCVLVELVIDCLKT